MTKLKTTVPSTLWQDIVAATDNLGPEATALRIPLLVELRQSPRGLRERLGAAIRVCSPFLTLSREHCKNSQKGRALFCFPHGSPSNINNLLPVAREACRRGLLGGILATQSASANLQEFAGIAPIVLVEHLLGQSSIRERVGNAARVVKEYRQITATLSNRLQGFRLKRRRARLAMEVTISVLYASACEHVLDSWLPSCIISTSDFWPFEHQLFCQASRRQIPSLVIQHGAIDNFWWPFVADVYCMWGDAHADQMQRIGAPAERLKILGMPATDKLFGRATTEQCKPIKTGIQPVCLLLSQTNGKTYEPEVFRCYRQFLAEAIHLMPFVTWRVKLHPLEDDSFYREMGDTVYERLTFYPKQVSLEDAVKDADVATTVFSTAGLESMVMNRPLIVAPAAPRVQELAWWPAMGGGTYAASAHEFQTQLIKLTSNPDYRAQQMDAQQEFLSKSFANQGHAAERIVDLLEEYSNQPPASRRQSRLSA